MPKSYSLDLRERVVRFVEAGHSRRAAAARFEVSVSFAVILMRNYRRTKSVVPKPSGGRRHSKLDPHRAFLLGRVVEKDDITMPELAAELAAAAGIQVAPASLALAHQEWLSLQKKRCWPASKIVPTSARRGGSGRPSASRGCSLSRTDWCSSMKPEPPRR